MEFQPEKELGRIVKRTSRLLSQNLQNELNSLDIRITVEQWSLLFSLWETEGSSQTELGKRTFKDKPTTTRMLKLLEAQQLIQRQRDNVDRRAYHLFLTPKGRGIVEATVPVMKKVLNKAERGLTRQESVDLKRMLKIVNQNLST